MILIETHIIPHEPKEPFQRSSWPEEYRGLYLTQADQGIWFISKNHVKWLSSTPKDALLDYLLERQMKESDTNHQSS